MSASKKSLATDDLLQAWAKLHQSYEATNGGQPSDAHNYLTGGVIICCRLLRDSETTEYTDLLEALIVARNQILIFPAHSLLPPRCALLYRCPQVRRRRSGTL